MAAIKSYTDIEQSKKLAEILPTESADMCYDNSSYRGVDYIEPFSAGLIPYQEALHLTKIHKTNFMFQVIPCWSLAALIKMFDDKAGLAKDYGLWYCYDNGKSHCTRHYDEPIDAAFEMICWLKENNKI